MDPQRCAREDCKNSSTLVSYFHFPDDHRRAIWLKHSQITTDITKIAVLCEKHFYAKDLIIKSELKDLVKNALPTSCATVCKCTEFVIDDICFKTMNMFINNIQKEIAKKISNKNSSNNDNNNEDSLPQCAESLKLNEEYKLNKALDLIPLKPMVKKILNMQLFDKNDDDLWNEEEKNLCLSFFYKSPSFYSHLLKEGFKMPTVSTIYRWHTALYVEAGFSKQITLLLKSKTESMTDLEKKCVLLFNEVDIDPELKYCSKGDLVYGFVDYGELGRQSIIASSVTIFTVRGLNTNWKQTISYYVGSLSGNKLAEILKINIKKCMECDLSVIAVCCNHGSDNRKAYELLGANEEKPFFEIEDKVNLLSKKKVFLLYDYSYLFIGVRNCLLKNNIKICEDFVSWEIIEKLFEEDSKKKSEVDFKLTKSHISPNDCEQSSPILATQVFSTHVAVAIFKAILANYYKTDADKKLATSTAVFICKMKSLFDDLNSDTLTSSNLDTLMSIQNTREWIKKWQLAAGIENPYCFTGLQQTLFGIEQIWKTLKDEQKFLMISHLNSDVTENLPEMARTYRGSYETNPTTFRLIRNLKHIIFMDIKSAEHSGYGHPETESLLNESDLDDTKDTFEEFFESLDPHIMNMMELAFSSSNSNLKVKLDFETKSEEDE